MAEIPVFEARRLADRYGKGLVVILCLDSADAPLIGFAAYGRTAAEKDLSARWVDLLHEAIGGDTPEMHQDYRATEPAELCSRIEGLQREVAQLQERLQVVERQNRVLHAMGQVDAKGEQPKAGA